MESTCDSAFVSRPPARPPLGSYRAQPPLGPYRAQPPYRPLTNASIRVESVFHRFWRRVLSYCKRMLMSGVMDDGEMTVPEWTREDENSGDVAIIARDVYTRLHCDTNTKRRPDAQAYKRAKEHFVERRCIEKRQKRRNRIAMNKKVWELMPWPKWGREHITNLQEIRKKRACKSVLKCELITYVYYAEDGQGQEALYNFYKSVRDCKSFIVWDVGSSDDPGKVEHWGRLIPGKSTPSIPDTRRKPIAPTGRLCIGVLTNQEKAPEPKIFDQIMANRNRYGIEALMVFVTKGCDSFLQGTLQYRIYNEDVAKLVCEEDITEQAVASTDVESSCNDSHMEQGGTDSRTGCLDCDERAHLPYGTTASATASATAY